MFDMVLNVNDIVNIEYVTTFAVTEMGIPLNVDTGFPFNNTDIEGPRAHCPAPSFI